MSQKYVSQPVYSTVCDLCSEIIHDDGQPGEAGSLTHGFVAHKVEIPRTKRAWLTWPPAGRDRLMSWQEKQLPVNKPTRYDFHAQCIKDLIDLTIKDGANHEQAE